MTRRQQRKRATSIMRPVARWNTMMALTRYFLSIGEISLPEIRCTPFKVRGLDRGATP